MKKLLGLIGFLFLNLIAFTACHSTMLGLNRVDENVSAKPQAQPPLDAYDLAKWQAARASIKDQFQEWLYGPWPGDIPVEIRSKKRISDDFHGGTLEVWSLLFGQGSAIQPVDLALALPPGETPPKAILVNLSFGSNCAVFPSQGLTAPNGVICPDKPMQGFGGWLVRRIFGEFIAQAPINAYFDADIGYANVYASQFIPDDAARAPHVMRALFDGLQAPTGTLMGWAYLQSELARLLAEDDRINPDALLAMGHSRFGKASLVAAAWSQYFAGAIALQSGFAGAALSHSQTGETLSRMINGPALLGGLVNLQGYPHWLAPDAARWADTPEKFPLDQHMLLALNAPKPTLLTNGRKDVWSDPNSTFRAAQGATPIYQLFGETGLGATNLKDFRPNDTIAYTFERDGHGVRAADIKAIIAFVDAWFPEQTG